MTTCKLLSNLFFLLVYRAIATEIYTSSSNETCDNACLILGEVCDETLMNRIASLHDSCLNTVKGIFWTRQIVETYEIIDPNLRCIVNGGTLNNYSAGIEVFAAFEDESRSGYCSSSAPDAWRRVCICRQPQASGSKCWKYSDTWFNAYGTNTYGIWPTTILVAWIVTLCYYLFALWIYITLTDDIFEIFWFSSPFAVSARTKKTPNFFNTDTSNFMKYHNKAFLWIGVYTAERILFRSIIFSAWFNTNDVENDSFVCPEILYYVESAQPLSPPVVHWFDSIGRAFVVVAFAGVWMAWGGKLPVANFLFTACKKGILANGMFLLLSLISISILLLLNSAHAESPSDSTISELFLNCLEGVLGLSLVLLGIYALSIFKGGSIAEVNASLKRIHVNPYLLATSVSGFVSIGVLEIICAAIYHQYQEYMIVPTMLFRSMLLPASEVITIFCCLLTLTSQIDSFSALELLPGSTRHSLDVYKRNTNEFCIEDEEVHDNRERYSDESKDEPSSPLVTLRQEHSAPSSVSLSVSDSDVSRSRSFSDKDTHRNADEGGGHSSDDDDDYDQKSCHQTIIVNETMHI